MSYVPHALAHLLLCIRLGPIFGNAVLGAATETSGCRRRRAYFDFITGSFLLPPHEPTETAGTQQQRRKAVMPLSAGLILVGNHFFTATLVI